MQEQTNAAGRRPGDTWTIEPCLYGRVNPGGEIRYMARVTADGKRFMGPWVASEDEAREHLAILRERGAAYAKDRRFKALRGQHVPQPELIYFVQAGDNGPVKIGRTRASLLERRLANLQIASPIELKVLGVMEGNSKDESELHQRLDHLRIRGEWFANTPELRKVISRRRGRGAKKKLIDGEGLA